MIKAKQPSGGRTTREVCSLVAGVVALGWRASDIQRFARHMVRTVMGAKCSRDDVPK